MERIKRDPQKKLIALLTNHCDDVYCFRKELIEGIISSGYQVLISCPHGDKLELMSQIPYIYDDLTIDRRGMNIYADLSLFRHYLNLMKRYRPDLVLCYTAKPNVYGSLAAARYGIPYINNITGLGSVLNKNILIQKFILMLFRLAMRKSTCIFFQNEENMRLALMHKIAHNDYQLIPGSGVNTNRFPLQVYPNGGNGIEGDPIIFNYIGRILHDKGIDDYIAAATAIKAQYPNTEFNIIGFIEPSESHYISDLQKLQQKGIVIYRGSQKDTRPFMARSHATIHPSNYGEGMSNVLLESASSGRVLITTDNAGCRETVDPNITGFIYSGGNIEELINVIQQFLAMKNEERSAMGRRGRDKVQREFSRQIVVSAYLSKITKSLNK